MQKIKIVDTNHEFQSDELRSHYMSVMAYLLIGIMKNEKTEELIISVRLIYPHLPIVKQLFKIVAADGSDISDDIYDSIAKTHLELEKAGILR